jgi:hypothetical protein
VSNLLADNDVQGQVLHLASILDRGFWSELWKGLALSVRTFDDVGLPHSASDQKIWQLCQTTDLILVTANRNDDTDDSLESTLRRENTPACLPVFTLADPQRISSSSAYAERVAVRMLEYLLEVDRIRGTGRLYLP